MKRIVHLSDLHFGTEEPALVDALLAELDAAPPALVAISGDLTQRAKDEQLDAARAFLDRLPAPHLVVPGNHDVPLYDLAARFFDPYRRYQDRVTEELMPLYFDDELAVLGLNTAHGRTIKGGRVTDEQLAEATAKLGAIDRRCKLVVAHHPFVLPAGRPERERVDHADAAVAALEAVGVELILSGHLHIAYSSDVAGFRSEDRAIVAIHAGTCFSRRRRGEPNGFNRIAIDGDALEIVHAVWDGARFAAGAVKAYRRRGRRWFSSPSDPAGTTASASRDSAGR